MTLTPGEFDLLRRAQDVRVRRMPVRAWNECLFGQTEFLGMAFWLYTGWPPFWRIDS